MKGAQLGECEIYGHRGESGISGVALHNSSDPIGKAREKERRKNGWMDGWIGIILCN